MFQQQPLDFRTVSISFYTVHVKKYKYKKLLYLQRDPKSFLKFIMSCPDSHYLIKNLYICTKIHYIIISLYISLYHNRFLTDFLKKYEELTKKKNIFQIVLKNNLKNHLKQHFISNDLNRRNNNFRV